jgi:hypothetical protein
MTEKEALQEIWRIVHTPTKNTTHRRPSDHYASDFDEIRKIIRSVLYEHYSDNSSEDGVKSPTR